MSRTISGLVGGALLLCGLTTLASGAPLLATDSGAHTAVDAALNAVRETFTSFESVRLHAQIDLSFYREPLRASESIQLVAAGQGAVDYIESGGRFRSTCVLSGGVPLAGSTDLAFDGDQTYFLSKSDGVLSIGAGEPTTDPCPLPNPLFLQIAFLGLDNDSCRSCYSTLHRLRDARLWQLPYDGATVQEHGNRLLVEFRPGTGKGAALRERVRFRERGPVGLLNRSNRFALMARYRALLCSRTGACIASQAAR